MSEKTEICKKERKKSEIFSKKCPIFRIVRPVKIKTWDLLERKERSGTRQSISGPQKLEKVSLFDRFRCGFFDQFVRKRDWES